jgi:hypothetical protein
MNGVFSWSIENQLYRKLRKWKIGKWVPHAVALLELRAHSWIVAMGNINLWSHVIACFVTERCVCKLQVFARYFFWKLSGLSWSTKVFALRPTIKLKMPKFATANEVSKLRFSICYQKFVWVAASYEKYFSNLVISRKVFLVISRRDWILLSIHFTDVHDLHILLTVLQTLMLPYFGKKRLCKIWVCNV